MTEKTKKPHNATNIIIGVLVIIVGILLLALFSSNKTNPEKNETDSETSSSAEIEQKEEKNTATNFSYIKASEWDGLERAERNIQSLGEGQVIVSGVVQDPTNESIMYFASTQFDKEGPNPKENRISIYSYNNDDFTFERLYKETITYDDFNPGSIRSYNPVGYDSGSLILVQRFVEPNPTPSECENLLALAARNFPVVSMDILDPYSGLDDYTPPNDIIKKVKKQEQECLDKLN